MYNLPSGRPNGGSNPDFNGFQAELAQQISRHQQPRQQPQPQPDAYHPQQYGTPQYQHHQQIPSQLQQRFSNTRQQLQQQRPQPHQQHASAAESQHGLASNPYAMHPNPSSRLQTSQSYASSPATLTPTRSEPQHQFDSSMDWMSVGENDQITTSQSAGQGVVDETSRPPAGVTNLIARFENIHGTKRSPPSGANERSRVGPPQPQPPSAMYASRPSYSAMGGSVVDEDVSTEDWMSPVPFGNDASLGNLNGGMSMKNFEVEQQMMQFFGNPGSSSAGMGGNEAHSTYSTAPLQLPLHSPDPTSTAGQFPDFSTSIASPMAGNMASPFGMVDFSPPVASPIQSPASTDDPFGSVDALASRGMGSGMDVNMGSMDDMLGLGSSSAPGFTSLGPASPSIHSPLPMGSFHRMDSSHQMANNANQTYQTNSPFDGLNPFRSTSVTSPSTQGFSGATSDLSNLTSMFHGDGGNPIFGSIGGGDAKPPSTSTTGQQLSSHFSDFATRPPAPEAMARIKMEKAEDDFYRPPVPPRPFGQRTGSRPQDPRPPTASTPGFNIWKPPVPTKPKPDVMLNRQSQQNQAAPKLPPRPQQPPNLTSRDREPQPYSTASADFGIRWPEQAVPQPGSPKASSSATDPSRGPNRSETLMQSPPMPQAMSTFPIHNQGPMAFKTQQGSKTTREQVPAGAWETLKPIIRQLYLEERKPLKEVMQIMADRHDFHATPKMYKTRFSNWGFVKNNTEDEVKKLLSLKFQRDARGKVTEFVRNGRIVNISTYLKRKGVTEYDLVDFETPADLPDHVRCRTPTPPSAPGYLRLPELLRAQETVVGNTRKAFLHCRQVEGEKSTDVSWTAIMLWDTESSYLLYEANRQFEMRESDQGGQMVIEAFKHLEDDLKNLSPQGIREVLLGLVNRDPGTMTALSKYLAAYATTNLDRSHPLRVIFTTLYDVQQRHGPATLSELVWGCIPTIAEELEHIYGRRHPYVSQTWIDLAMLYGHADPSRLQKLISELQTTRRSMSVVDRDDEKLAEAIALRYTIVQLLDAADPDSDETRSAVAELWSSCKEAGRVFRVRGADPNTYCLHDPIRVRPDTKRCNERYAKVVELLKKHTGVKVLVYFEEDMHTTDHVLEAPPAAPTAAPTAQDSWAAALLGDHGMMSSRPGHI